MPEKQPYILANGLPAPLGVNEIKKAMTKMMMPQIFLKPNELPFDKLTAVSQIVQRPYLHLMKTIISPDIRILQQSFLQKTIKYTDPSKQIPNYKSSMV